MHLEKRSGIKAVIDKANEKGAKRAILINTSGPFHTVKLEKAKKEFQKELDKINFQKTNMTVIKNLDGTPYKEQDNIRDILVNHMISPVRFDKTIEYMMNNGVDTFIEVGPGKVLTGFIKKVNKEAKTISVNDM